MSCSGNTKTSNCVCNTLLAIVDAQNRVKEPEDCVSSCDSAIKELGSACQKSKNYNTVPVILTCKNSCKTFVGIGGYRTDNNTTSIGSAAVFRVISVDRNTCCAKLELLQHKPINTPLNDLLSSAEKCLKRTGVCITVDLNNFSAVSCLPAVKISPCKLGQVTSNL